ncbi:MAG TPA: CHASE domain-containing protein, partial [Pseudomonadales bacterium]|nr:CHASE domain-containing protein [Pseudomonadales bacterium]
MDAIAVNTTKSPDERFWARCRHALSNPVVAWFVLVTSLFMTFTGWYVSNRYVEQRAQEAFKFDALQARVAIFKRMQEYELTLRGGVGLFNSSDYVSRAEWAAYVNTLHIDRYFPGVQGIGFARWVPQKEKQVYLESVQREGYPAFKIWPDNNAEFYASITYLEPFSGRNLRAFGYDMFSEPTRRQAMEIARDTGASAISGKVILVQETNQNTQNGFLMYLPVYQHGMPLNSVEERRAALLGFVYSPFRCKDLMAGILNPLPSQVEFEIYDGEQVDADTLMYSSIENGEVDETAAQYQLDDQLQLPARSWKIRFFSNKVFEAKMASYLPEAVAGIGLLFDALLFYIIWSVANQRKKLYQMADAMTAELARERSFLGALIGSLAETIIACDANGRVVFANQAASELFRFNLQKTPVNKWQEYITFFKEDGITEDGEDSPLFDALKGALVQETELCLVLKNGQRISVMLNGRPIIGAGEQNQGAVVVLRDITNDKQTLRVKESEARFRLVFEAAPSAMIMVDRDGAIQLVNAQAERMFGYSKAEMIGQPIELLVGDAHRKQHEHFRGLYQYRPEPRIMGEARDLFGVTKTGKPIP